MQEPGETETYFRENKGGMSPQLLALALIRSQRFIGKLQPVGNPLLPEQQHPKLGQSIRKKDWETRTKEHVCMCVYVYMHVPICVKL